MKKFDLKNFKLEPHHIICANTTEPDYQMSRWLLLEVDYNIYVVVEGSHCSCYGFDECTWDAIEYTRSELQKLVNSNRNFYDAEEKIFWNMVSKHVS